jgi:transcriptional regulator with XRE-family HTH domain
MSEKAAIREKIKYKLKSHISELIRYYRSQSNLSQEDLAQKAGVSYRTVLRIENGQSCNFDSVLSILVSLGLVMKIQPVSDSASSSQNGSNGKQEKSENEEDESKDGGNGLLLQDQIVIDRLVELNEKNDKLIDLMQKNLEASGFYNQHLEELKKTLDSNTEAIRDSQILSEVSFEVAGINYLLKRGLISEERAEERLAKKGIDLNRFLV